MSAQKFVSVAVTDEQNYNIPVNGVALVKQASTTTITITYLDGLILTLTHATAGAGDETMKDGFQDACVSAIKQLWRQVVYGEWIPSFAVSAIVATHVIVPAT